VDSTAGFLRRRLIQMLITLVLGIFVMFLFSRMLSGDPIRGMFGWAPPPPEVYQELRHRYGLDKPFWVQFFIYFKNLLMGDFGYSLRGDPIRDLLLRGFPISIRLLATAVAAQVVLGISAGVVSGMRGSRFTRTLLGFATVVLVSIPVFVAASMLLSMTGYRNALLPVQWFLSGWRSYILPSVALSAAVTAYVVRLLDAQLSMAIREPFIKTARAKGLSERRVVWVHAVRVSIAPVMTLILASLSHLLMGLIFVEAIFNMPGLGWMTYEGIRERDYNLMVAALIVAVLIMIVASFVADVVQGFLDPRIRSGRAAKPAPS
jgi:oligopeptide transport system permease protein